MRSLESEEGAGKQLDVSFHDEEDPGDCNSPSSLHEAPLKIYKSAVEILHLAQGETSSEEEDAVSAVWRITSSGFRDSLPRNRFGEMLKLQSVCSNSTNP